MADSLCCATETNMVLWSNYTPIKMYEKKNVQNWVSLVAQWLRIRLPMQGTRVRALIREDPTCRGATKPMRHNYWACALEPMSHNYWARAPRAHAPQQEKPPQWEACPPQRRVAPARYTREKPACSNEDPTQPKINKFIKLKKKPCYKMYRTDITFLLIK